MTMQRSQSVRQAQPSPAALRPYAGRWVAIIGSQVIGVGETSHEAWVAARRLRPKEEPILRYVKPPSL